jgi:hypothetical protein
MARAYGADSSDTQALGHWKAGGDSSVYRQCYDTVIPMSAMMATATFNGRRFDQYHLPRGHLRTYLAIHSLKACLTLLSDPPEDLLPMFFPWVEEEQAKYQERVQMHGLGKARDYMLEELFKVLLWFRMVILQDAAILSCRYPGCQLWNYPPFNTDHFRSYASASEELLAIAEREGEARLNRLPDAVATSFRGIITSQAVEQRRDRSLNEQSFQRLENHMGALTMALTTIGSKSKRKKALEVFQAFALTPVLATPPPQPSQTVPSLSPSSAIESDPSILHQPHITVSLPSSLPSSSDIPLSILPLIGRSFVLSIDPHERTIQIKEIEGLMSRYPVEKLLRHRFLWIKEASRTDEWRPEYTFAKVNSIDDVWREYTEGIDGQFSVRELEERWAARWKRNVHALKTEHARRRAVLKLVTALAGKTNWNTDLALRFLRKNYPISSTSTYRTLRQFTDALQCKGKTLHDDILENARTNT